MKNYNTEANITNLRGIVPNCSGNESHIDDCPNSAIKSKAVCNPVLVDCGTTSASSGGSSTNIAAAVSVPRVLLAVVCGIIIAVFFMWRRKCKQKAERRCIYIILCIAFQAVPTLSLSMFIVSSSGEKQ